MIKLTVPVDHAICPINKVALVGETVMVHLGNKCYFYKHDTLSGEELYKEFLTQVETQDSVGKPYAWLRTNAQNVRSVVVPAIVVDYGNPFSERVLKSIDNKVVGTYTPNPDFMTSADLKNLCIEVINSPLAKADVVKYSDTFKKLEQFLTTNYIKLSMAKASVLAQLTKAGYRADANEILQHNELYVGEWLMSETSVLLQHMEQAEFFIAHPTDTTVPYTKAQLKKMASQLLNSI